MGYGGVPDSAPFGSCKDTRAAPRAALASTEVAPPSPPCRARRRWSCAARGCDRDRAEARSLARRHVRADDSGDAERASRDRRLDGAAAGRHDDARATALERRGDRDRDADCARTTTCSNRDLRRHQRRLLQLRLGPSERHADATRTARKHAVAESVECRDHLRRDARCAAGRSYEHVAGNWRNTCAHCVQLAAWPDRDCAVHAGLGADDADDQKQCGRRAVSVSCVDAGRSARSTRPGDRDRPIRSDSPWRRGARCPRSCRGTVAG